MLAYCDETREPFAGLLRPGNAGSTTAVDQITVVETALEQIPREHIELIEILLRVESAGASHGLLAWAKEAYIRSSVGYDVTVSMRTAVLQVADQDWIAAVDQDGTQRANGQIAELTGLDLKGWPAGSRVIVRRERPHPGAQLSFTDHDGHRL